ncbi:TPA: HIT family protein [Candidatus Woesearchaeota archaeon]|nr:HIT family protein [Candidatus Woesearchaeota archaeon]
MSMLEGCPFCLTDPSKSDIPERTVLETENFRVFPTLGQIVEGYLLVAPKEHYASVGALPDEMYGELEEVKDRIDLRIRREYCPPIWIEHGGLGQTVFHAHLHAVPFPPERDIYERYSKDFPEAMRIHGFRDLKRVWNERGHYLFYEINGFQFAFVTKIVPMYARLVIADELGVPERGNWRTMDRELDERMIAETVRKLRR